MTTSTRSTSQSNNRELDANSTKEKNLFSIRGETRVPLSAWTRVTISRSRSTPRTVPARSPGTWCTSGASGTATPRRPRTGHTVTPPAPCTARTDGLVKLHYRRAHVLAHAVQVHSQVGLRLLQAPQGLLQHRLGAPVHPRGWRVESRRASSAEVTVAKD